MQLHFDADSHTYRLNGLVVPSVTQVLAPLNDYSMVPPDILEAARIFGTHVHEACDLFDRGELDWESLDPALVPYVEGWRNFLNESGAIVIQSEARVYHPTLGYAGTPDKVLAWKKSIVIPDLKATAVVPPTVGPQTAAYSKAYHAMHGGRGREPLRYCIHLKGGGKYSSHVRNDPIDWNEFVTALNWQRMKEKYRVRLAA